MNSQREGLEEVMRVIAGKYKSRQLKAVPTKLTRPTTDKNKENLSPKDDNRNESFPLS